MNATLAHYANYSIYSAIVVLTLSMLAYAAYLARAVPARAGDRERVLVGAGGVASQSASPVGAGSTSAGSSSATDPGDDEGASAGEPAAYGQKMGRIAGNFAWLGTLLLGAAVVLRGLSVQRAPFGNLFEFVSAASLAVMLAFCLWSQRRDLRWLGVFVVTPVLLLLLLATQVLYTQAAALMPALQSYWLTIHVTVAIISVGIFTLAGIVTALYLVMDHYERRGAELPRWARLLPRAADLERTSYSMHIVAFPLWTFTVMAGAIWARQAWASYWNWDPKEVWSFVIWVVYAAYLHARATTGITRQKAAWIALAGLTCIVVNYTIVNVYFVGQHSYSGL
ncbi:MAG: c-type cytochrome biogenesis protein CcsB [Tetrasphaera sp.]